MNGRKLITLIIGSLSAILGTVGILLPILPTVPLYLLAAWCFARSSKRLHAWFTGTRVYQENLESYVKGQGMTKRAKIRIMVTTTAVMTVGFVLMDQVVIARVILACVWVFHLFYFGFRVKTLPETA